MILTDAEILEISARHGTVNDFGKTFFTDEELIAFSYDVFLAHSQKFINQFGNVPHPLDGLHINQGSMDSAADAYEAEYKEAHK